jgi:uncharacterized protein (DUF433 family)
MATLDLKALQSKLADARQEVRNLTVLAMYPDLTAEEAEAAWKLERSARAEVKLRIEALKRAKMNSD